MNSTRQQGPGSPAALRQANRSRVLSALAEHGTLSQAALARATGLAPSTVSALVAELTDQERVQLRRTTGRGRARHMLSLATDSGVVVGIDHGRFHLAVAVSDMGRRVLAEDRVVTSGDQPVRETLTQLDSMIDRLLGDAEVERTMVRRGCLALPAPIDSRTGRIGSDSILPGWAGIDPGQVCREALGFTVSAHNDTTLGAVGEWRWGAGRGVDNLAYVWGSEGVGCGLVVNGAPYSGIGGVAGEIGHTLQRAEQGDLCRCGNRGCLETVVSSRAVIRLLEPQVGPLTGFDHVVGMAQDGNMLCRRVLAETGRHIGVAVANLVNLLDPQRVILGGDLCRAGDLVLEPMTRMVRQYAIPSSAATVEIVPAELGRRSEVLGAISRAVDECVHLSNTIDS